jgi:hypothetical protein
MESGSIPPDPTPNDHVPRGAIVVVVAGVLACIVAALLTSGKGSGEAAHLEFVQQAKIPDSRPVAVPGSSEAKMQLIDGKIQATGTNVEGYSLFRVRNTLKIDEGAPVREGHIICSVHATKPGTLIGQSSNNLRTTYPRSSEEGVYGQPIPESILVHFASHGYELAVLEEVGEDLPEHFATIKGVKVFWPEYEEGTEHIEYRLPAGKLKTTLELPFYTVWRSQKPPAAKIACRLNAAAGKATATTEGSLPKVSPPINEEAEAERQEEKEEASGKSEESESE